MLVKLTKGGEFCLNLKFENVNKNALPCPFNGINTHYTIVIRSSIIVN